MSSQNLIIEGKDEDQGRLQMESTPVRITQNDHKHRDRKELGQMDSLTLIKGSRRISISTSLILPVLFIFLSGTSWALEDTEENVGTPIGFFKKNHHSVSGNLFAINDTSILIKGFNYDGSGKDAYFWGGSSGSPSSQGFIIADEHGRTNVLEKYENRDIVITLPESKQVNQLRWLSVYDLNRQVSYGDVYVPDEFQAPGTFSLGPLTTRSDDVSCESVELLDSKRFRLKEFSLHRDDGQEIYFWVGKGHLPSPRGRTLVPDENGYLEPLRIYNNEELTLMLPGELTIQNIDWFAVYDTTIDKPLAYSTIPTNVNVPPFLSSIEKYPYSFPHCEQLHSDFQISWDVAGQTISFEMIGLIGDNQWMGFGLSGSPNDSQMIGSDVAVGWLSSSAQGHIFDFNIDSKAVCTNLLDHKRGVCRDSDINHPDSIQYLESKKLNGLISIKYRRQLSKADDIDKDWNTTVPVNVIWAIGKLLGNSPSPSSQLGFHKLWSKTPRKIQFGRKLDEEIDSPYTCHPFIIKKLTQPEPWKEVWINDGKLRSFTAQLGPSGGEKGYEGLTGLASPGLAWYIHGYLSPQLIMQRGLTYSFRVEGGNSPTNVQAYHPFVIATEPNPLSSTAVILSGVAKTRRGQARPIATGGLCLWTHTKYDRRLDYSNLFPTFEKYRNSLKLRCENGSEPGILEISPNSSWPDVVYYGSYVAPNMGWKIHIVDSLDGQNSFGGSSTGAQISLALMLGSLLLFCTCSWCCIRIR